VTLEGTTVDKLFSHGDEVLLSVSVVRKKARTKVVVSRWSLKVVGARSCATKINLPRFSALGVFDLARLIIGASLALAELQLSNVPASCTTTLLWYYHYYLPTARGHCFSSSFQAVCGKATTPCTTV